MTPLVSGRHIRTLSVHVSCPIAGVLAMPERDDVPSIPSFARVRLRINNMQVHFLSYKPVHTAQQGGLWFLGTQLDSG